MTARADVHFFVAALNSCPPPKLFGLLSRRMKAASQAQSSPTASSHGSRVRATHRSPGRWRGPSASRHQARSRSRQSPVTGCIRPPSRRRARPWPRCTPGATGFCFRPATRSTSMSSAGMARGARAHRATIRRSRGDSQALHSIREEQGHASFRRAFPAGDVAVVDDARRHPDDPDLGRRRLSTARRAGRIADGMVVQAGPSDRMAALLSAHRDGAKEVGRTDPIATVHVQLSWAPTDEEAMANALQEWLDGRATVPSW